MNKNHLRGHDTKHVRLPKNYCYGCGQDNEQGLRLKFVFDEAAKSFVSRFRLSRRYVGPPGHAHGGVIATILDEAMGKVNKIRHVVALTKEMTVEYLKPVPLGQPLIAEGRERHVRGRVHTNVAEIRNQQGEILARSRGKFIAIDAEKMFAKHLPRNGNGNTLGILRSLAFEKRARKSHRAR
ncbi:MAG: PaaI family thioesterase [Terriglobales bacterium]